MWQEEITDAEMLLMNDEVKIEDEWYEDITDEEMLAIDADGEDDDFNNDLPSSGLSNYMECVFSRSPSPPPSGGYPPLIIASDDEADDSDNEDDEDDEFQFQ